MESGLKNKENRFQEVFSVSKNSGVINQIEHLGRSYASENIYGYKVVAPGDVVYTKSPTSEFPFGIIKQNKLDRTGVVSVLYAVYKPVSYEIGSLIDYYFSEWRNAYNYLKPIVRKGAKNTLNIGNKEFLDGKKIALPVSGEETEKICNFLDKFDAYIKAKKDNFDKTVKFKAALANQIFSRNLIIRCDDGTEFPEWKTVPLSSVASRVTRKNSDDNQNVLTISGQHGLISQRDYFNKNIASKNLKGYFLLKKGEFAYNKSYSSGYPMGAIKCLNKYDEGVVSSLYICFKFNAGVANYFEQYFEAGLQNKEIEKVAQEGARNHGLLNIGINDFFNINILLPSEAEQAKIAQLLFSIDTVIELQRSEIELLVRYKKGLLQQMFI